MIPQETAPAPRRLPLLAILLLGAVVLLAVFIATNVLGVLFAVIAPPLPPTPPDLDQVSYSSEAYGVDYWKYTSGSDVCDLVSYIQENGGVCQIAPMQCGEYRELHADFSMVNAVVGRCGGQVRFSIFNMQWWALFMRLPNAQVQLELHREVYWMGTGPQ